MPLNIEVNSKRFYLSLALSFILTVGIPLLILLMVKRVILMFICSFIICSAVFYLRNSWKEWKGQKLILTPDSIFVSSWKHPVFFRDIDNVSAHKMGGSLHLFIGLKKKIAPISKQAISPFHNKVIMLDMKYFMGTPQENVETIMKFFKQRV